MRWLLAVLLAFVSLSAQSPGIDEKALLSDLRTLSADDMQGRETGTAGGARARAFVVSRFKASGLATVDGRFEHPFTFRDAGRERQGVNVLGQVVGSRHASRYLIVSAHYDHVGVRGGRIYNGANDNASGTAALIALARVFAAERPLHTILFAAFDAEESGFRGARAFVASPQVNRDGLVLDLNMDMIGRDPNNTLFVSGVSTQPFLKSAIERVAARAPVRLRMGYDDPTGSQQDNWVKQSDQFAFLEAGIPALYFGVEDYAQHHQPTDDYATMTFDFYGRAVRTMLMVIQEFDANLETIDKQRPR